MAWTGVIFNNLSLQERLTVIPRVCKSWAKAVNGPYCWQEIDIEEWSSRSEPRHLDRMLEMLITRSSGSLRKLCVSGLQTERIFTFIAENEVDEYYDDESESYDGMWEDERRLEELEFRVYEGIEDAGLYWPPSP
ncbi:Leucine-rich repeat domain superfamily [Sesbania bispinosa]|nr:Leucine-rich repeat domain superfamily [Sesbania bispinosa]